MISPAPYLSYERPAQNGRTEAQQERLACLGQTIAGIAHSIKNMLGMIKAGEYLVESGLRQSDLTRIADGWGMVKEGNGYISDLVIKMLALSRDTQPKYEEIALQEIANSVVAVLLIKAKDKNADLHVQIEPPDLIGIVDVACMREAWLNIADNAVDACPADTGEVIIGASADKDGWLNIYTQDNGPGIPLDVQEKLFHPFFTTKGQKGTGLGLAVSQKIVHEHHGTIYIDTTVKKGTRIVMRLPHHILTKTE